MSYLKNLSTGAVTENLDSQSEIYRKLVLQKVNNKPKWEATSITDLSGVTARVLVAKIPALGLTADESVKLTGAIDKGGTITSVEYTPDAAITGAATNTRTLTLVDLDSTTTLATLALTSGVNPTPEAPGSFTVNSAAVVGGNAIEALSAHGGTGIADPGGIVTCEVTYTA
jgi:hypothetical protein